MKTRANRGTRARRLWLATLIAFAAAQTLGRLYLFSVTDAGLKSLGVFLHLSSLIALAALAGLVLWLLSLPNGRRRYRSYAAALLLAGFHAAWTVFDITQAIFIHLTTQPAAIPDIVGNPPLTLSLLDNVGIGPHLLVAALAGVALVHALAYLAIHSYLTAALHFLAHARLRVGRLRANAGAVFALVLVTTYLLGEMVPMQARRDSGEPILASLQQKFQIAPASLLAGAAGPAPPVSKPANPPPSASRPLVLIVVDALRRDRMGVYNPELANTPFLSGLASAGQLQTFDAYATCTFSFCGMMSILASRSWNDFGSRPDTIVDRLHDHSYSSHLVLSGQHSKFGNFLNLLAKSATIADQPRGEQPSDLWALGALQRLKIEQPRHSFIYLHLMSAHAGSFIEPKYRVTPDDEGHLGAYLFSRHGKASYREIYDKRVAQADDVIRRAFSLLRDKGMLDDALIIITSDHGQRIAEGGRLYHGGDADPATLNIPLLVVDPRRAALPPRFPASQIDIAPTFAKAIGVTPGAGWKGEALQAPSRRVAVPVGTAESTGAVVRVGGGVALFLCHRRTGKETVYAGGKAAGHRPDLPRLRRLHLQASAPVRDRACNATGATASASAAT